MDGAAGAKARSAELIYAYIDVEPVSFHRNHYCIDITFYYRILADTVSNCARPSTLCGLAVFTKRAILCGEDSSAKIFTSDTVLGSLDGFTRRSFNHPAAVVEVLDPMILSSKVRDICECSCSDGNIGQLPEGIQKAFEEELVLSGEKRRLYVTLGQFSIIRLERDVQLVVPTLECGLPTKECCDNPGYGEDPCEMFSRIEFPAREFFPKGCPGPDCNGHCPCDDSCGYRTTCEKD